MPNWWETEADLPPGVAEFQRRAAYYQRLIGAAQQEQQQQWAQPQPQQPEPQATAPQPKVAERPVMRVLARRYSARNKPSTKPATEITEPVLPPGAEPEPMAEIDYTERGWELGRRLFPWWMSEEKQEDASPFVKFLGMATAEGIGRVIRAIDKPQDRVLLGGSPGTGEVPEAEAEDRGWFLDMLKGEQVSSIDPEEYLLSYEEREEAIQERMEHFPKLLKVKGDPLNLGRRLAELEVNWGIGTKAWEALTERWKPALRTEQVGAAGIELLQEPAYGLEQLTGATAIRARQVTSDSPAIRRLSVEQWYPLTRKTWSLATVQILAALKLGPELSTGQWEQGWGAKLEKATGVQLPGMTEVSPTVEGPWGEDVLGKALAQIAAGTATADEIAEARDLLGAELVGQMLADPLNLFDFISAANRARKLRALTAKQAKLLQLAEDNPKVMRALDTLQAAMEAGGQRELRALQKAAVAAGESAPPSAWEKIGRVFRAPFELTPEAQTVRDLGEMTIAVAPTLDLFTSADEALELLARWADDPAGLVPLLGRVPQSAAGRKAGVIIGSLLDEIAELPSMKAEIWNAAQFWKEFDGLAHDALRLAYGYETPGRIGRFFAAYKSFISEIYLTAIYSPGYVIRNTFGDALAMGTDGLLTFEDAKSIEAFFDQFGTFTTRRIMTEGAAQRLAETGMSADIKSMLPGIFGRISKRGQRMTRYAEPLGRLPFGEESRYRRAFYKGLKRFFDVNAVGWTPDVPDIVRLRFGDQADHLVDALAHELSLAKKRKILDDFLAGKKGAQFSPTRYIDPVDLDAMSPAILGKLNDALREMTEDTPFEEVRQVLRDLNDQIDIEEARRLSEMEKLPARVHVTTDVDEAEVAEDLIDELEEVAAKTGDPELAKRADEIKQSIPEVEEALDTARREAVEELLSEPNEDGLEIIMRANAEVEDLRDEWRKVNNKLRREAVAEYNANPKNADEIWRKYFNDIDENWTELARNRIGRFGEARDQLQRLRGGESLDDILGATARQKRAEAWLLKASEVPERPKGFLPGRVLRSGEDDKFDAFLAWRRAKLDRERTKAWRAVYGTEPEDYGRVLDLMDSADRDIEQFGKATSGKVRKLYEQTVERAKQAARKHKTKAARARAVDLEWERYYILRNDLWTRFWEASEQRWQIAERDTLWGNWARGARMEPPTAPPKPPPVAPAATQPTLPRPGEEAAAVPEPTPAPKRGAPQPGDEELVKSAALKADSAWTPEEKAAIERWTASGRGVPDPEPEVIPAQRNLPPYTREQFYKDLEQHIDKKELAAIRELMDSIADTWAQRTGRKAEEWYTRYLAGFHRGNPPTFELFQRAENIESPKFSAWFEGAYHKLRLGPTDPNPKTFYHGSPGAGYEWFDLAHAKADDLYGPGLYFTDAPDVASGYAGSEGIVRLAGDPEEILPKLKAAALKAEHPEVRKAREALEGLYDDWEQVAARQQGSMIPPREAQQLKQIEGEIKQAQAAFDQAERTYGQSPSVVNWDHILSGEPDLQEISRAMRRFDIPSEGILEDLGAPGVYPVYVSLKNPFDIDEWYAYDDVLALTGRPPAHGIYGGTRGEEVYNTLVNRGHFEHRGEGAKAWANEQLKKAGYDGIMHTGGGRAGGGRQYHQVAIAFEPNQVKSIWNQGDWSRNRHLLYQGSEAAPRWWYKAERVVDAKMPNRATVEQVRAILTKGGVKQDELQWSGVLRWLDNQEGTLTKEDVLGYLQENRVQVEEVVRGGAENTARRMQLEEALGKSNEEVANLRFYLRQAGYSQLDVMNWPGWIVDGRRQVSELPEELRPYAQALKEAHAEYRRLEDLGQTLGTKYGQYTLPGGEEYRELLLTLPVERLEMPFEQWMVERGPGQVVDSDYWRRLWREQAAKPGEVYESGHWQEPNVVAHVRFNDRTGPNGERVLFIEEIQSDWHQAGRERGYAAPRPRPLSEEVRAGLARARDDLNAYASQLRAKYGDEPGVLARATMEEQDRWYDLDHIARGYADQFREYEAAVKASQQGVPPAPFAKTWDELTLKRMYRWAAENDYDAIAWTTGAQQADRYNLAKYVDELDVIRDTENNWSLVGRKNGAEVVSKGDIPTSELPDYIGKDLATKIDQAGFGVGDAETYSGIDLRVGGHGMTTFYDRILPYSSNKLTKRWGVEAGTLDLPGIRVEKTANEAGWIIHRPGQPHEVVGIGYGNTPEEVLSNWYEGNIPPGAAGVHGFTIPEGMKRDLLDEGLPLFQKEGVTYPTARRAKGARTIKEENRLLELRYKPDRTAEETAELAALQARPRFMYQGAKGAVDFLDDGRAIISLFEGADFSTVVHEMGHVLRRVLPREELRIIEDWVGLAPGDFDRLYEVAKEHQLLQSMTTRTAEQENRLQQIAEAAQRYERAEEQWARGFERYLAEGQAPTEALQKAFEAMKQWLLEIYHKIVGSSIDVKINDEVRGVMDRLITDQPLPRTKFGHGPNGDLARAWADPANKYEFRYRIADIDDVIASHTAGLDPNPRYPARLQPRQRSRADSANQIDRIAKALDPEELVSATTTLDTGPMIVGADGVVESGNGRYLALQRAIAAHPERYQAYLDFLREKLAFFGFEDNALDGLGHPILVRERITDVDRAAFAKEANEARSMRMSTVETAGADVGRISDDLLATLDVTETESIDAALKAAKNRPLVQAFMKNLSPAEASALRDASGELAQAGLQRLKAALLASTYQGDAGTRLLSAMTESVDPVIKNLENAIYSSLGQISRAEAAIRSGTRAADLAIADDVAAAVDVLARLKREGPKVPDYLAQIGMFGQELDNTQLALLRFFEDNKRSSKTVRELLQGYAAEVMAQQPPNQAALFGGFQRASKEELLNIAAKKLGLDEIVDVSATAAPPPSLMQRRGPGQMGMFDETNEDLPLFSGTAPRAQGEAFRPGLAGGQTALPGMEPAMGDAEKYAAHWAEGSPPPRPKLETTAEGYYVTNAEGLGGRSFPSGREGKRQAQAFFDEQARAWDEAHVPAPEPPVQWRGEGPPVGGYPDAAPEAPGQMALGGEEAQRLEELRPKARKGQMTLWQQEQQTGFWYLDPDNWRQYIEAINQPGATAGPLPHEILQRSTDATRRALGKIEDGMGREWDSWRGVFADQDAANAARQWFDNEVVPSYFEGRMVGFDYAQKMADEALLDYSKRRNFDTYMSYAFPYHYWFTRAGKNWAKRLAQRPGMLAGYLRTRDAMRLANENAGRRERFAGSIKVPFPWLPEWMGDSLYVDPMALIAPYSQIFFTDWDDSDESRKGLGKLYGTARQFGLRPYHFWDYLYQQGLFSKAGEYMGMSPEDANKWLGPEYKGNVPYALPQTGVIKGVTSLARELGAEAMPPGGINIEAPFRQLLGLPAGEVWDPYRINRMLANMAAESPRDFDLAVATLRAQQLVESDSEKQTGKVWHESSELAQEVATAQGWTPEQLAEAQEILAQAMQRAALERGIGSIGWLTGPRISVEPTGERAQLEMAEQARATTWSPEQPGGSRAGYEQFKTENPAMYPRATQYNILPGEKEYEAMPPGARANWMLLRQQREMLHDDYDRAVDEILRAEPWNWTARNELETQRRAALAELQAKYPLPEMSGELPAILYGMNPGEMWDSTVEQALYRFQLTKPDPGDYETEEGVDWSAYYTAEEKWRANLPKAFTFGYAQGGIYNRMDPKTAMRNFEQRYDSPLEAAHKLYEQEIAAPAWDAYNQAKNQAEQAFPGAADLEDQYFQYDQDGRRAFIKTHPELIEYWQWKDQQGSVYQQTVGRVEAVPAVALIPAILARYQTQGWTEEQLKQELAGVVFPPLAVQQDLKRGSATTPAQAGAATYATRQPAGYTPEQLAYLKNRAKQQWARRAGWGGGRGKGTYTSSRRWRPPSYIYGGPYRS